MIERKLDSLACTAKSLPIQNLIILQQDHNYNQPENFDFAAE